MAAVAALPKDLITVGRVLDAWGLQGGIKVARYSNDADALLGARHWWLKGPAGTQRFEVSSAQHHGRTVRAVLQGVADREAALALRGATVSVARGDFPALGAGEYYWVDLIGLEVVNPASVVLGRIRDLMESGAHPILVVEREAMGSANLLIPFVGAVVRQVDLGARRVVVDWEADY